MNQILIPLHPIEVVTSSHPGAYKYNRNAKLPLIQRIIFWFLSKLDCDYVVETTSVTTVEFDMNDIVGLVYNNQRLLEQFYHLNVKYLIVGADMQRKVMNSDPIHFQMVMPSDYKTPTRPDAMMFANLHIVMVPYLNGLALLEELP